MPLTVRQMIKLLERDGWYLVHQAGGHRQCKHLSKLGRVTVPGSLGKDLPAGTESSILRQAGLRRRK